MIDRPPGQEGHSLVAIRAEGSGAPFFCVPAFGSDVDHYRLLSHHLGPEQRFYVLVSRGLDGRAPPHDKIEDMAASYVEEMRRVQPHGPYFLGGASSGGTVAWEMAQQLRAKGERVALLVLIDAYHRGHERYLPDPRPGRTGIDTVLTRFDYHVGNLVTRDRRSQLGYLAGLVEGRLRRAGVPLPPRVRRASSTEGATALELRVREANFQALIDYFPERYQGRVTMLYATGESIRPFKDRRLLWSSLASDGLELRLVEGEHETLLDEPWIRSVAKELAGAIHRAEAEVAREAAEAEQAAAPH
jgi:thioesterase domain-containing protein